MEKTTITAILRKALEQQEIKLPQRTIATLGTTILTLMSEELKTKAVYFHLIGKLFYKEMPGRLVNTRFTSGALHTEPKKRIAFKRSLGTDINIEAPKPIEEKKPTKKVGKKGKK